MSEPPPIPDQPADASSGGMQFSGGLFAGTNWRGDAAQQEGAASHELPAEETVGNELGAGPGAEPPPEPRFRTPLQPSHFLVLAIILGALYSCAEMQMKQGYELNSRARASRAKNDMRTLATSLEAYFVDFNAYPAGQPLPRAAGLVGKSEKKVREVLAGINRLDLNAVATSGTRLLGRDDAVLAENALYGDPLAMVPGTPFVYHSDANGWILVSCGPDVDYDIVPARDYDSNISQPSAHLVLLSYDPTNGTVSNGDVFRVKQ